MIHKNYFYWVSMFALLSGFTRISARPVIVPARDFTERSVLFVQKISVVDATGRARLLDGTVHIARAHSKGLMKWDEVKRRVGNTSEQVIGDLFVQVKNFEVCRDTLQLYVKECLNARYYDIGYSIESVILSERKE